MSDKNKRRDIPELRGMSIWRCAICGSRVEKGQRYVDAMIYRQCLRVRGVAHWDCVYTGEYECHAESATR